MSERIELGESGWEEIEAGILRNRATGERIDIANRKLYDAEGNLIADLQVQENEEEDTEEDL